MKNYKQFKKHQEKEANKQVVIIEKQLRNELSESFWNLCLKSDYFNTEHKEFIKENCMDIKIDLSKKMNENWFTDTWNYVKKVPGKVFDFFVSGIDWILNGVQNFVKGVVQLAKDIFMGMIRGCERLAKTVFGGKEETLDEATKKADAEQMKKETPTFKEMIKFYTTGQYEKAAGKLESTMEQASEAAEQQTIKDLDELKKDPQFKKELEEEDKKNEFFNFEEESNVDYISEFAKFQDLHVRLIKEAEEKEAKEGENQDKKEGEKKSSVRASAKQSVMEWLQSFFTAGEKPDPKKPGWWMRLILRLISGVCGFMVKLIELGAEVTTNAALNVGAKMTEWMGGPKAIKYIAWGSIVAAMIGVVLDVMITLGAFPSLGDIKTAIIQTICFMDRTAPGTPVGLTCKIIKWTIAVICVFFGIQHILHKYRETGGEKFKGLDKWFMVHHDHDHGHEEHKEGEGGEKKPAAPGAKPAPAPGAKPAVA
jgi:hypothetical protein